MPTLWSAASRHTTQLPCPKSSQAPSSWAPGAGQWVGAKNMGKRDKNGVYRTGKDDTTPPASFLCLLHVSASHRWMEWWRPWSAWAQHGWKDQRAPTRWGCAGPAVTKTNHASRLTVKGHCDHNSIAQQLFCQHTWDAVTGGSGSTEALVVEECYWESSHMVALYFLIFTLLLPCK